MALISKPNCGCSASPAASAGARPVHGHDHLPRRPCHSAGIQGPRRRLHRPKVAIPALRAAHAEGPGRCGRCLLRRHRLFAGAGATACSPRPARLGLPVKLHAEQLSNLGGAALAARHGALSADHLEYLDAGRRRAPWPPPAPSPSSCPAPSTPCAKRKCRPSPPCAQHGVPMAVATDCNPGSSPMTSLTLAMNMACTLFRLTPGRGAAGHHRPRRPRPWPDRPGPHRPRPARRSCIWDAAPPRRTRLPHRRHPPSRPHLRRPP